MHDVVEAGDFQMVLRLVRATQDCCIYMVAFRFVASYLHVLPPDVRALKREQVLRVGMADVVRDALCAFTDCEQMNKTGHRLLSELFPPVQTLRASPQPPSPPPAAREELPAEASVEETQSADWARRVAAADAAAASLLAEEEAARQQEAPATPRGKKKKAGSSARRRAAKAAAAAASGEAAAAEAGAALAELDLSGDTVTAAAAASDAHEDDCLCVVCLDAPRDTALKCCGAAHPAVLCGSCAALLLARVQGKPACPLRCTPQQ